MDQSLRLLPRAYAIRDQEGKRRLPTFAEVARQFVHNVNFFADRRAAINAFFELWHTSTFVLAIWFFARCTTWSSVLAYFAMFYVLAGVVNTFWYHRYCSHHAFRFSRRIYPKIILWLNPIAFREEVYALVHHIHHDLADQDDDPYGPHLGAFGNFIASAFEVDSNVSEQEYERIKKRMEHVGIAFASLESFRRWRSVEWIPHYLARWAFAQIVWGSLWYAIGGRALLLAWFASLFTFSASVRDFNYRGHGTEKRPGHVPGWDFDRSTFALNQRFYGWLAGEWHNNHHAFRTSANTGFLRTQIDVPFLLVKLLHRLGIVSRYNDHKPQFEKRYAHELKRYRYRSRPQADQAGAVAARDVDGGSLTRAQEGAPPHTGEDRW